MLECLAAEPFHQVGGVLAQHDRAGRTRLVLARILVEEHARHALRREGERQHQADRPGADDDHRVHGAAPGTPVVGRVEAHGRRQEAGAAPEAEGGVEGDAAAEARGAITERMQPTGGARVK